MPLFNGQHESSHPKMNGREDDLTNDIGRQKTKRTEGERDRQKDGQTQTERQRGRGRQRETQRERNTESYKI